MFGFIIFSNKYLTKRQPARILGLTRKILDVLYTENKN